MPGTKNSFKNLSRLIEPIQGKVIGKTQIQFQMIDTF
jgi:hypothetical protein